ncbi:uncharacterized protein KGF55_001223 [Candida pseudojiufengensis]|uniref:uncharacterized protein n=1 Tax=Candida pseudojiufengensis TaxID=497109 RepID=UPI0022254882|nr:uncharacterized protein KGF55_001223 [Candida pseudojiufengensis]KAI5965860.1 hypothetical protein KGF55_001223 [Candida pseudojiufengensis]
MPPKKQKFNPQQNNPTKSEITTETEPETESNINEYIMNYMKSQYRPYSLNDIMLNLHGKFKKSKLTQILGNLVDSKQLILKTIGKTNYYCYKEIQLSTNDGDDKGNNNDQLSNDIVELTNKLSNLKNEINKINQESTYTNEQLIQKLNESKLKLNELDERLKQIELNNKTQTNENNNSIDYVTNLITLKEKQQRIVCNFHIFINPEGLKLTHYLLV